MIAAAPPASGAAPTAPEPEPCGAAAVVAATDSVLAALAPLTGVILPGESVQAALAAMLGCSEDDPLIALAAVVIQVGEQVPDPGVPELDLPGLPLVTVPPALTDALGPASPVVRPLCAGFGQGALLALLVADAYPVPVSSGDLASLAGQLLVVCGALQPAPQAVQQSP